MKSNRSDAQGGALQLGAESSGAEAKLALTRLAAEMKSRTSAGSDSRDFFLSGLRTLTKLRGNGNAELRLSCLMDCGRFFFYQGRVVEAFEAARYLEALANRVADKVWLRKAETLFGMIHAEHGRAADAVIHYSRALKYADEADEYRGTVSVLVNLGVALNYSGLYREAIPCLQRAISLAKGKLDANEFEAAALCNLAQSFLYLDRCDEGFQAIQDSLEISTEPNTSTEAFHRTVRELTFVQLALEVGHKREAGLHADLCCHFALRADTVKATFLADIAKGMYEIHCGSVDKGFTTLQRALGSAVTDLSMFRADALVALMKSYDEAGRPEEALSYLKELMAYIRATREKGVFALSSIPCLEGTQRDLYKEQDLQPLDFREAKLRAKVAERRLADINREMLERLAITADMKEEQSGKHGFRVGMLASLLASRIGWSAHECETLDLSARLHDIGKIGVPDRILFSSSKLREAERELMSTHTLIGAELLSQSEAPHIRIAQDIARSHHEWWNGEGYPFGLKGKRISVHSRIVALADVFDALTHGRPFSAPWTIEEALEEIRSRRGTQFDPDLCDAFLQMIEELRSAHCDFDEFLSKASRKSPLLAARDRIRSIISSELAEESH